MAAFLLCFLCFFAFSSKTSFLSLDYIKKELRSLAKLLFVFSLSVVVPTTLPLAMSDDGSIVTATDCRIINNSYGAVRVKKVTITAAQGWNLTPFGMKSAMAYEKVNSNKIGFALSIGGSKLVKTTSEADTQVLISSPITGCYMTGIGDRGGNTVDIDYSAIVTPVSRGLNHATVANVVFVVEWDTVD